MSTHDRFEPDLPDDIDRWPTDPTVLFGVPENVSRRDLKRAYSRLIRRYKPEHAPDQFRRLREAFEQFDQRLQFREMFEAHRSLSDDSVDNSDILAATDHPSIDETLSLARQPIKAEQNVIENPEETSTVPRTPFLGPNQLWQSALDGGDLTSTYSQLAELTAGRFPTETNFAQLYWLLTLHPEFDQNRDACQWLMEGMRRHGNQNRLQSILSLDVRRRCGNVSVVLDGDLFVDTSRSGSLVEFLQCRWYVARHFSKFDLITADLQQLRRKYLDDTNEWRRILCAALQHSVIVLSESASSLLGFIREEFEGLGADLESDWQWDWYESTLQLHKTWGAGTINILPADLRSVRYTDLNGGQATMVNTRIRETFLLLVRLITLVEKTWGHLEIHARPEILSFCEFLTEEPEHRRLELSAVAQVARPLVRRLWELLQEQKMQFSDQEDFKIAAATQAEILRFAQRVQRNIHWQKKIYAFCQEEAVTPLEIAFVLESQRQQAKGDDSAIVFAALLRNHLPLNCMVEAQRALW